MKTYLQLGEELLEKYNRLYRSTGNFRQDRTKTGTVSVFGRQVRFDLRKGFPLLTTKKMFTRGIIAELIWFLAGSTDNNALVAQNVHIWDEWALPNEYVEVPKTIDELNIELGQFWEPKKERYLSLPGRYNDEELTPTLLEEKVLEAAQAHGLALTKQVRVAGGELGPVYGAQWRSWPNPKATEVYEYTALERYEIAKARLDAGEDVPFTAKQLDFMRRGYGLFPEIPSLEERAEKSMVKMVHQKFADWGIPKTRVTERPIDQIAELIHNLKKKPYSRRHIISAWNPTDLPDETKSPQDNVRAGKMALAPCHTIFQFYVEDLTPEERVREAKKMGFKGYEHEIDFAYELMDQMDRDGVPRQMLSCQLYQRSADYCLGVPFNIASYALLTMMVAQCVGMVAGEFIHTFGDLHIYANHIPKFELQAKREPYHLPTMRLNPAVTDIFSFKVEDFELVNYKSHEPIDFGRPAI